MTRKYRVEAVASRSPVTHYDFIRPRNAVTLVRIEDGKMIKLLIPGGGSWNPGQMIVLHDLEIAGFEPA